MAGASREHNLLTGNRRSEHYHTVESLQECLLVAQGRFHLDLYTRQPDGTWLLREASRHEDAAEPHSIGCQLLLGALYERVELPASNAGTYLAPIS